MGSYGARTPKPSKLFGTAFGAKVGNPSVVSTPLIFILPRYQLDAIDFPSHSTQALAADDLSEIHS